MENAFREIASMYGRTARVLKTDGMVMVGGSALKLSCDPDRPINDLDIAVMPSALDNVSRKAVEENGFTGEFDGKRLVLLTDKKTGVEVEVSSKNCGALNKTIGLPLYDRKNPTILGLNLASVIDEGDDAMVYGTRIRIPNPMSQLMMKYNLWLYRGEGKVVGQKDAQDIINIVKAFFNDAETVLKMKGAIAELCKARSYEEFARDLKKIMKNG